MHTFNCLNIGIVISFQLLGIILKLARFRICQKWWYLVNVYYTVYSIKILPYITCTFWKQFTLYIRNPVFGRRFWAYDFIVELFGPFQRSHHKFHNCLFASKCESLAKCFQWQGVLCITTTYFCWILVKTRMSLLTNRFLKKLLPVVLW